MRSERIVLLLTNAQGRIVAGNLGAWPTTITDNTPGARSSCIASAENSPSRSASAHPACPMAAACSPASSRPTACN
ncbi:hypothetical protein ACFSUK_25275 [Sphingobium scionense]